MQLDNELRQQSTKNNEQWIDFLVKSKAYPIFKNEKVFFIRPKQDKVFDKLTDKIIEELQLKTAEDCKKIRGIIKEKAAKIRKNKPIKKWFKDERPREMLIKIGAENLPLSKLLAILLRTGDGFDGSSAEDIARKLLDKFKDLRKIDQASIEDLCLIRGIGMAKAVQIKAALEIGKRFYREKAEKKKRISSSKDVIRYVLNYYRAYLMDSKKEFFSIVLLDGRNKIIKNITISEGSLNATLVDPKQIIKEATKHSASALIFVHNHPSGEAEPTKEDIEITNKLIKACDLVDLKVLDHIIIGQNRRDYTSFLDKGFIKEGD